MNVSREKERVAVSAVLYLLAWLLPGLCLVALNRDLASLLKLLLSIAFFAVWHLSFKKLEKAVFFSLFVFLLLPFDLFFFAVYQEPPTTPVFFALFNTNVREALDFLHGRVLLLLAIVSTSLAVWWQAVRAARLGMVRQLPDFPLLARSMSRVVLGMAVFAIGAFSLGHWILPTSRLPADSLHIAAVDQKLATVVGRTKGIFPIGRFVSGGEYFRNEAYLQYAELRRSSVRFNARQLNPPQERQIYVLVLGETARGDHSQLNGYARETSPLLMKKKNVVPLRDVASPWSVTAFSVPTILTGQRDSANGRQLKSVISAFREAGFKTYWLSNQQREDGISYFSREADEVIHMSPSALVLEKGGNYDQKLIPVLEQMLDRNERRQFFVLHLLGSHDAYQKRYPASFDVFKPSLTTNPTLDYHDRRNKVEVVNTYDNSIRYTDYVLSNIIDAVGKRRGVSALIYSSDHGETLFDGHCPRSGHGSSSRHEFVVNALSWVSEEHRTRSPDIYRLLEKRGGERLTTEFIFETMLGLADIQIAHGSPQYNLVGPAFQSQARWVNAQKLIDSDKAVTKGSCSSLVSTIRS